MEIHIEHDAIIIGNGEFPTSAYPLRVLNKTPFVVCCDGGANEYVRNGHIPNAIVGDGDSLVEDIKKEFADIIHYYPCQETNDQTKAVKFLMEQGYKNIAIIAATGKREDHTLGNISLLIEYMRKGVSVYMYTDYGIFIPCDGTQHFPSRTYQQVSIFNISATGFSSEGLRYPIYDFNNWWQGTLNETTSTSFTIKAEGEYIVFITYDTK